MNPFPKVLSAVPIFLVLTACGDGGGGPDPTTDCSEVEPTTLGVGDHAIIDASNFGCVRLPAAGASGAEYLYVALSAEGRVEDEGVTAGYELEGAPTAVAAVRPRHTAAIRQSLRPTRNGSFDAHLRDKERELTRQPGAALARGQVRQGAMLPPQVGDQRTFKVCETPECTTFVDAAATAQVVTEGVAIYLDDAPPAGGFTPGDLDAVGALFDNHLYPIDTTAFGRESDIDNNGVVIVLLTQRINDLSPNCEVDNTVILGYFFGLDLLTDENSNSGEVFYGAVPDPSRPECFDKEFIVSQVAPLFIHEFQHMISFNQHALERGGESEQTWLNEGLSHFAEELGGRLVPDTECQPTFPSCEVEFIESGDLTNAFDYLGAPESFFLIEPGNSGGELEERGANWLFVRWLADHFAQTQPQGTELTRALVETSNTGTENVEAVTNEPFDELVSQWQLANYLDNLPNFTPTSPRLQYLSWDFRNTFGSYPLEPDVAVDGAYNRIGVLRGGSGRHVLITQQPNAAEVGFKLTQENGSLLPGTVAPRAAIARIR